MSILSRRTFLAGAAYAGAAFSADLWRNAARAAAPAAGKQAASYYRYKIGSLEITVVSDGINTLPVTPEFVLNVKVDDGHTSHIVTSGPASVYVQADVTHAPFLFARHPGFRRVRLFRHKQDPSTYVTVDVWSSKADYEAFRSQYDDEYRRLNAHLALLKMEEAPLGYYEGTDEYRPPVDTRA